MLACAMCFSWDAGASQWPLFSERSESSARNRNHLLRRSPEFHNETEVKAVFASLSLESVRIVS